MMEDTAVSDAYDIIVPGAYITESIKEINGKYEKFLYRQKTNSWKRMRVYQCQRHLCQNVCKPTNLSAKKYCSNKCEVYAGKQRNTVKRMAKKTKYELHQWEKDLVKNLRPVIFFAGIYFCYKKGELRYIGKSNNIHNRVFDHMCNKGYDKYEFFKYSGDDLTTLEAKLIRHYMPPDNVKSMEKVIRY